jgi:LPXTG-motif cell wall-anchored protein
MTGRIPVKRLSKTIALALSAAALMAPAGLQAQFTTFVRQPASKAAADSAKPATVAAARARSDSVTRMSITSMKEWVDSAAGVSTAPTAADSASTSAVTAPAPATTQAPNATSRSTTTFSNGAIAPNTASPLPAYLAAGLASMTAGLILLFRFRRRPAEVTKRRG